MDNVKGMHSNDLTSITSQSASLEHETAWISLYNLTFTDAFLFEALPKMPEDNGIIDRAFEGNDNDVSESLPKLCMQDVSIECVLESEPEAEGV